jgi:hypothetical protein
MVYISYSSQISSIYFMAFNSTSNSTSNSIRISNGICNASSPQITIVKGKFAIVWEENCEFILIKGAKLT